MPFGHAPTSASPGSSSEPRDRPSPNRLLAAARRAAGWTQKELADRLGTTDLSVSRWERGEHVPSPFYNYRLCELFGKSAAELGFDSSGPTVPFSPVENAGPKCFDPSVPIPFVSRTRPLVGREALMSHLKTCLVARGQPASLALTGLPGVGKTALAVALAHDPQVQAHFPDGILWASLGPQANVLGVLARWAHLLGLMTGESVGRRSLQDWGEAIRFAIGHQRMLLVIDDAWGIEAALACKVGGRHTAYVLTTRLAVIALQFAGDEAIVVPELGEEDGLQLLSKLAPKVVQQELEEARLLVQAVGGLPLALTLLGSNLHLQARSGLARRLQAALERFRLAEERLRHAEAVAPLDRPSYLVPGASLSLQVTIAVSDEHLEEEARRALYALSVFPPKPNTFTEEAALAVTEGSVEVLDRLVDAGLLEPRGNDQYCLHQTIVDYARLIRVSGDTSLSVPGRFVRYYTRFVQDNKDQYDLLEQEQGNIYAAINMVQNFGLDTLLVSLVLAIFPFLRKRGLYVEAETLLTQAEIAARLQEDESALAHLLYFRGRVAEVRGQYAQALAFLDEGLGMAHTLSNRYLTSQILSLTAIIASNQGGDISRVIDALEEELKHARLENDSTLICQLLGDLAIMAGSQGLYAQAAQHAQAALTLARAMGDSLQAIRHLNNLGVYAGEQGSTDQAMSYLQEALMWSRQIGDKEWIANVTCNIGEEYFLRGEDALAETYWLEGLDMARQIGYSSQIGRILIGMTQLSQKRGNNEEIQANISEALSLARQAADYRLACVCLDELGKWQLKRQQVDSAAASYQEMLQVATKLDTIVQSRAQFGLAQVAAAQDNLEEAFRQAQLSLKALEATGHLEAQNVKQWLQAQSRQ